MKCYFEVTAFLKRVNCFLLLSHFWFKQLWHCFAWGMGIGGGQEVLQDIVYAGNN